ncbi:TPA_asm: hypothetical protein GZX72_14270 [Listeria monocytogenes]|nr:hypothetical protein [Listeria monocytogenes]
MFPFESDEESYKLENESDKLMIDVLRKLSEAVDKRCIVHGKSRYLDKALLSKSIHLCMIYSEAKTLGQLTNELDISSTTMNRMLKGTENYTVNRVTVDKVIDYMNELSNKLEVENKKAQKKR